MKATGTALLAALSVLVVGSAPAQTAQTLPRGARVRVTPLIPLPIVVGELIAVSDSALLIRRQRGGGDISIRRADVLSVEVSRGTRRAAGAGWGALLGLAIGGVIGFASGNDSCGGDAWFCLNRPWAAGVGATAGLASGSLIGLVVGSFERWRDAGVPTSLSVVPTGGGSLSIGGRIAF
jgi:hypothetical protein